MHNAAKGADEKPVMTLSHWGQFDAPVRFLPSYLANMGKDVVRPVERFDGEKWKLVCLMKNGAQCQK